MTNQKNFGKSPYQRTNSSARSRGPMLVITVVILLLAAGAWIMTYTRAVGTTPIGGQTPIVDPNVHH